MALKSKICRPLKHQHGYKSSDCYGGPVIFALQGLSVENGMQSRLYQLLLQHLLLLLLHLLLQLLLANEDLGFLGLKQQSELESGISVVMACMTKRRTSLYVEALSEKEGFIRDM